MIVIDASVVIASLLPEKDRALARSLIASEVCASPDLIVGECVNAIWKNVRLRRILASEAKLALEAFETMGLALTPLTGLADRALELAITLDHPAYDCFYLALAEARGVEMVTQDRTFARKVRAAKVSMEIVRLLDGTLP